MNIFAIIKTPDFFISKFNLYQSQKIYFFEIFLSLGLFLNLILKPQFFGKLKYHYIYIIIGFNPFISPLQKILLIGIVLFSNTQNSNLIFKGIKHGIFLNLIPAIFQILFQKSLGLFKIGESKLNLKTSQIAKINFLNIEYIRSYGLLAHPNILAFLSTINPKINSSIKNLINLITLSGSNTLALYLKKIKNRNYINLTLVILIIILAIKGENSISSRVKEMTQANSHQNFQPIHNIFIECFTNKNYGLLYGLLILLKEKFSKIYFIIPILLLDHFIISSYACFTVFIIYTSSNTSKV